MLLKEKQVPYLLMTPGPLSTSPGVRSAMWYDSCTWDDDYKSIVTEIRSRLLALAGCDPDIYTSVLMQGSGTFGVEAVLGSTVNRKQHCLLILQNGVYGKRMGEMAKIMELPHVCHEVPEHETFRPDYVRKLLEDNTAITHIAVVHCETTTGLLNDIEGIAALARQYDKYFIVDAMSSFAGIEFDVPGLDIDFLVSSANKCIQGVPGFSFIICKKSLMEELCRDNAKSLSLDLYGQWKEMEKNPGKWRYTSPTHTVLAFRQALLELEQEGSIAARARRYCDNQRMLVEGMRQLGFETYIEQSLQSSIITTFLEPDCIPGSDRKFDFTDFYHYLKSQGFVIYPGKISNRNSFRIGTIGHLFPEDIARFLLHVKVYIKSRD